MKLERFMKRANRGILLGSAILLGLAGYITADSIRFKNSKDDIKNLIENFAVDYMKASESDVEGIWTKQDKEQQIEECCDVLDTYFTDNIKGISLYDSYGVGLKSDFKEGIMNTFSKEETIAGNVSNTKIITRAIKVRKNGVNGASITGEIDVSMTRPYKSGYVGLSADTYIFDDYYEDIYYDTEYDEENSSDEEMTQSNGSSVYKDGLVDSDITYSFEAECRYIDNEWKFVYISSYINSESSNMPYNEKEYKIEGTKTDDADNAALEKTDDTTSEMTDEAENEKDDNITSEKEEVQE